MSLPDEIKQKRSRKVTLSAFLLSALAALTVFVLFEWILIEVGDFSVIWSEVIRKPVFFLPGLFAALAAFCMIFFRKMPRLQRVLSIVCTLLFVLYLFGLASDPVSFLQIITQRDQIVQKASQQIEPLFTPVQRQGNSQPALYFEQTDSQTMPSERERQEIEEMIGELPDVLRSQAAGIYFLSEDTFNQAIAEETSMDASGFSRASNFSSAIKVFNLPPDQYWTILRDGTKVPLSSTLSYKETIVHELTHLFDVETEGDSLRLSSGEEWQRLYERNKNLFGSYGALSPVEFFAEAGVYYFLYPQMLQQMDPDIYSFFEQAAAKKEARAAEDLTSTAFVSRNPSDYIAAM